MTTQTTAPAEIRTIWEGELVATVSCPDIEAAWSDYLEATLQDDGYTIQLVQDGRIVAEETNPDENGEI